MALIDVKAILDDNSLFSCEFGGSSFVDKVHNHLIIGNLRVITNNNCANVSLKVQSTEKMELVNIEKLGKAQLLE